MQGFDIIGDLHGQYDKACALLRQLGYVPSGRGFAHPEGRKVVFLGDYIDRGPKIRETLHLVRSMVEAGHAFAIMGNHEYNAVAYATPNGEGSHLRPHSETNVKQHQATLEQFRGHEDEWQGWLQWFRALPMYLEFEHFRVVHACWSPKHFPLMPPGILLDDTFLQATGKPESAERLALDTVLKGPEIALPDGQTYLDREVHPRRTMRVRWWDHQPGMTLGAIAMPVPVKMDWIVPDAIMQDLPRYEADEKPVFFGHYWFAADSDKAPLASNVVCLDFSGALDPNPLVAYRWNGAGPVTREGFFIPSAPDFA